MGFGFTLSCPACRYSERVLVGQGMLTPQLAEQELERMQNGEYGREFREQASLPGAAVYLSRELLVCSACGAFRTVDDVALCLPRPGHEAEACGPALFGPELEDEYETVLKVEHVCEACGGAMEAGSYRQLRCPKCREPLEKKGSILWD